MLSDYISLRTYKCTQICVSIPWSEKCASLVQTFTPEPTQTTRTRATPLFSILVVTVSLHHITGFRDEILYKLPPFPLLSLHNFTTYHLLQITHRAFELWCVDQPPDPEGPLILPLRGVRPPSPFFQVGSTASCCRATGTCSQP